MRVREKEGKKERVKERKSERKCNRNRGRKKRRFIYREKPMLRGAVMIIDFNSELFLR